MALTDEQEARLIRLLDAPPVAPFDWNALWAWAKPFATLLALAALGWLGITTKEAAKDANVHAQTAVAQSQANGEKIDNAEKVAVVAAQNAAVASEQGRENHRAIKETKAVVEKAAMKKDE